MTTNTNHSEKALIFIISIFIGSMTISSILASKIICAFGLFVPAGVLAYSVTFVCTDVISEIWGRERAQQTVMGGFIALVTVLLLVQVALAWEAAPFWKGDTAFKSILSSTPRIIIASFCAYLVSQFHDVHVFHYLRKLTGGRHLWLRNTLSTAVSQLIDSVVFITIAFYGEVPVVPLIIGQWLIKFAIAILDTPVIYLVVRMLRHKVGLVPKEAGV